MKRKPKPNMETMLMREACLELEQFSRRYKDWLKGIYEDRPNPEELLWPMVKYARAWNDYRISRSKYKAF